MFKPCVSPSISSASHKEPGDLSRIHFASDPPSPLHSPEKQNVVTSGSHFFFLTRVQLPLSTGFSHFSNEIPKAQTCQDPALQGSNLLSTTPGNFPQSSRRSPLQLHACRILEPIRLNSLLKSRPLLQLMEIQFIISPIFLFKSQWEIRGPKKGSDLPKVTQLLQSV